MSQRNLPASFWNSHYHAGVSGYGGAGGSVALAGHEGLYPDYSSLHGLHQGDPWAYNFTAAGQYPHHRSMADFTYMPSSSRYAVSASVFPHRPPPPPPSSPLFSPPLLSLLLHLTQHILLYLAFQS